MSRASRVRGVLIWLFKEEVSLQDIGCNRVAVPRVDCSLIGSVSRRSDSSNVHLMVDPLVGTAEFRFEQVAVFLLALSLFHNSAPLLFILRLTFLSVNLGMEATCFKQTDIRRRILGSNFYHAFYRDHERIGSNIYWQMMCLRKKWEE